LQFPNLVLSRM